MTGASFARQSQELVKEAGMETEQTVRDFKLAQAQTYALLAVADHLDAIRSNRRM